MVRQRGIIILNWVKLSVSIVNYKFNRSGGLAILLERVCIDANSLQTGCFSKLPVLHTGWWLFMRIINRLITDQANWGGLVICHSGWVAFSFDKSRSVTSHCAFLYLNEVTCCMGGVVVHKNLVSSTELKIKIRHRTAGISSSWERFAVVNSGSPCTSCRWSKFFLPPHWHTSSGMTLVNAEVATMNAV